MCYFFFEDTYKIINIFSEYRFLKSQTVSSIVTSTFDNEFKFVSYNHIVLFENLRKIIYGCTKTHSGLNQHSFNSK